ncbi:MAG TPA: isoprenylcysteine carboxylmethyltransferase family protein [Sphingomicrobium sp.]|nr:isoprenylcysteine carboxylmethyltransferase family protein [Sphingomicrobium sp.]
MSWAAIAILGFVTLQRLVELIVSRANTKRLLAAGGHEVASGHYYWLVTLHLAWLITLWDLAPGRPISPHFLLIFILIEIVRFWTLWTLGRRWTTRIIVVPGETLVTSGPYRFVNHPNYWVVTGEIAVLPLVFGLWPVALLATILNAAVLSVRVRAEDRALGR